MDISHEGASISMNIKALEVGEGFVVTLRGGLGNIPPKAQQQATNQGITGQRLNVHRDTFEQAKTTLAGEIDSFVTDLNNFIQEYNTNN